MNARRIPDIEIDPLLNHGGTIELHSFDNPDARLAQLQVVSCFTLRKPFRIS